MHMANVRGARGSNVRPPNDDDYSEKLCVFYIHLHIDIYLLLSILSSLGLCVKVDGLS